ncbi:hypothetical protein GSB9_02829 [Flavobacteriaceae bacterium GSB9]|nr:hypothetical protein GSB9_02829 [Flavobacteriaceae bacterium GSB9]
MKTLIYIINVLLLMSCGEERVYTTGSYGTLKSFTEKQHYVDHKTSETYISGDLSFGLHMQDDSSFDDTKTIASLHIHRNATGKFYNYYYGLGASLGAYRFKEGYKNLARKDKKASFYNVNFKSGINYTYTRPKIDYRFLGVEVAYNNEFGDYQKKIADLAKVNDPELIVVNQKSFFTYHLFSEYVFKLSSEEALTVGFYAGGLIGIKETDMFDGDNAFRGFTVGVRLKKHSLNFIYELGQNEIRSAKLGLTYQL